MSRKEPNRNVYVGHRYVPLILEEWDKKFEYEGLSVVTHKGASYTSKKRVPVGIDILNKEFWSLTGNYNAQVDYYRDETEKLSDKIIEVETDLNNELDDHKTSVNNNLTTIENNLNNELDDHKTSVNSNLTAMETSLNNKLDDHKTSVNNNLTAIETNLNNELDDHKTSVNNSLTTIENNLNNELDDHKTVVDNNISDVTDIISDHKTSNGYYNIINDGTTDNKDLIQGLINNNDNIKIVLPKGKVNMSTLAIPTEKNVIIEGQGVNVTELIANDQFINITGDSKKTLNIYNDINKGDFIINLNSTTNISVNDLITFRTTENMEENTYANTKKYHTAKIKAVNVNEIRIDTPFPNNFSSDYTITADVYKTGKIIIKDMTVKGEYKGFFLDIEKTSDLELLNLNIVNTFGGKQGLVRDDEIGSSGGSMQGISLSHCIDTKIDNVSFDCLAYGVMPTFASVRTIVSNSYANRCRHIVAPTGGAQTTKVIGCTTNECWAGFDSHQTCYDTYHYDCISYNDDIATGLRGRYDYAENCSFDHSLFIYGDGNADVIKIKHLNNVKINGHLRGNLTNSVKLESVDIKGALYATPYDDLIIRDVKIEINDFTPINDFPPSGVTYAIRLSEAENTIIDGLSLKGEKSGIANGGGVKSSHNFKAFTLVKHNEDHLIQMSNIVIDGFDVGIDMPAPFDFEKYIFSNILIKNSVVAIDTSQNYKDNVNIEKVFFKDCGTDISDPGRLR